MLVVDQGEIEPQMRAARFLTPQSRIDMSRATVSMFCNSQPCRRRELPVEHVAAPAIDGLGRIGEARLVAAARRRCATSGS